MQDNQSKVVEVAGKLLGKQLNDYKTNYDPTLLVPVQRELNRTDYGITNDTFVGYDAWHAYEFSFLTKKGLPTTAVAKVVIPADSEFFVESKSMKLYFYSLNMEQHGDTREEGMEAIKRIVEKDLSEATQSEVKVQLFLRENYVESFCGSAPIELFIDVNDIEFTVFNESPELIEVIDQPGSAYISIGNVRSNCRVTHQPDWATLYVKYEGNKTLDLVSLQKFVVSFRNENHFHEEVCEQIFKMLSDKLQPDHLMVGMLYTRRGGIDICPIRATSSEYLDKHLIDVNTLTRKTINQ